MVWGRLKTHATYPTRLYRKSKILVQSPRPRLPTQKVKFFNFNLYPIISFLVAPDEPFCVGGKPHSLLCVFSCGFAMNIIKITNKIEV